MHLHLTLTSWVVKYKWYKPQLAVLGIIHWIVLTWWERGKKQLFHNTSFQLKLIQSNKELAQSLYIPIMWGSEGADSLPQQAKHSTSDTGFIIQCHKIIFFQKCNVYLYTLQLPTYSCRPKAVMFRIWLYGLWHHVGLHQWQTRT